MGGSASGAVVGRMPSAFAGTEGSIGNRGTEDGKPVPGKRRKHAGYIQAGPRPARLQSLAAALVSRRLVARPPRSKARARYLNMREKKPSLRNSEEYSPYLAAIFCVVLQPGGGAQRVGLSWQG